MVLLGGAERVVCVRAPRHCNSAHENFFSAQDLGLEQGNAEHVLRAALVAADDLPADMRWTGSTPPDASGIPAQQVQHRVPVFASASDNPAPRNTFAVKRCNASYETTRMELAVVSVLMPFILELDFFSFYSPFIGCLYLSIHYGK